MSEDVTSPPQGSGKDGFVKALNEAINEAKKNKSQSNREWLIKNQPGLGKLKLVTHIPKATHSSSGALPLLVLEKADRPEIGTHSLEAGKFLDSASSSAYLGVVKFLFSTLEDGKTQLIQCFLEDNPAFWQALEEICEGSEGLAAHWRLGVRNLFDAGDGAESYRSSQWIKQIYWLAPREGKEGDPPEDADYILLQPLFSSALAQYVDDFVWAARRGRKEAWEKSIPWQDMSGVMERRQGGANAQNVSFLTAKRTGRNFLFSCAPPQWKKSKGRQIRLLDTEESVLDQIFRLPRIQKNLQDLREFVRSEPPRNMPTRNRRERLENRIFEEIVVRGREIIESQPEGWSSDERCRLSGAEKLWLDPGRLERDEDFSEKYNRGDWADGIASDIARKITRYLQKDGIPVGDANTKDWARKVILDTAWPVPMKLRLAQKTGVK